MRNVMIGHGMARVSPHFLNRSAVLLGFYPWPGSRRSSPPKPKPASAPRFNEEVTMLRIQILGASVLALMLGSGVAAAADLQRPYPAAPTPQAYSPAPAYSWTGPYVGGILGYGWGTGTSPTGNITADDWLGGLYAGYNFQADQNWVAGVEGDVLFNGMAGTNAGGFGVDNPWDATLRLRAGYAYDRFLFYGTGGLAVGAVTASETGFSQSATHVGWTLGAGIEAAVTSNVTARAEYRYTDLGSQATGNPNGNSVGFTSNALLLGVGMKF
jgi:outer membrane immunogenic protein